MKSQSNGMGIRVRSVMVGLLTICFFVPFSSQAETTMKNSSKSLHSLIESTIEEREVNEGQVLELLNKDLNSAKKTKIVYLPIEKKMTVSDGH